MDFSTFLLDSENAMFWTSNTAEATIYIYIYICSCFNSVTYSMENTVLYAFDVVYIWLLVYTSSYICP